MRKSRAKLAAPSLYPENTPGYRKPIPAVQVIRSVPVQLALRINEHVLRLGRRGEAVNSVEDRHHLDFGGIAEITAYHYYPHSQDMRVTGRSCFFLGGADWSCHMFYQHWPMGGADCFEHFGKHYAIIDYTMHNKRGWLRDMTIARMVIDDA